MTQPTTAGTTGERAIVVPELLDVLIVGGGPSGTAAAFRAKELGLTALVIDFDDVLKRIRDYPKDKQILPDFGGGDRMAFPAGDACVSALQFDPIDKDDMCSHWKGLYRSFGVPALTAIELSSVERDGDVWKVNAWDHKKGEAQAYRARHVVLGIGRGVPRRLDVSGNADGIAYRMDDPVRYATEPVLVVGGGTSAAEAVLAISEAKIAAGDDCAVYWSFRGTKMPRVSKALAERFFEAFIGNGNIRSLPDSEPVSVVKGPDKIEYVSMRVDRKTATGRPSETVHLEFSKARCIACIGEDIPEALLLSLGISMVAVGTQGKKMMAVTPLLETQQPNIYLIGDLLSQSYLEVDDFSAPPETFRQVKHRGNIKTSLRDGVFVAEVIKQRIDGRKQVNVVIGDAQTGPVRARISAAVSAEVDEAATESPADQSPDRTRGSLVLITPAGIEAEEFRFKPEGTTTLGRTGCDITFPQDTFLSDSHASVSYRDGDYYLRDDGSRTGTYLRVRPDHPVLVQDGDLVRAGRQILMVSHPAGGEPTLDHFDASGAQVASYPARGTVVFGRSGGTSDPDVVLDNGDATLSRFHLSVVADGDGLHVHDFGSKNGTFVKVEAERKLAHGDVIRVGTQQLEVRLREELPEKKGSAPVPVAAAAPVVEEPPPVPVAAAAAGAAAGPHITFAGQNKSGPLEPTQTLLAWADENEVSIDYECWIGMCGCDAIRVVSGAEHLNDVTEKEIKTLKRKGLEPGPCRLACMTRARGPVVVEVIG